MKQDRRKQIIALLLAASIVSLSATGCAQQRPADSASAQQEQQQPEQQPESAAQTPDSTEAAAQPEEAPPSEQAEQPEQDEEPVPGLSDQETADSGQTGELTYIQQLAQDIADELRDKKDDLTYSADELEQIEERLDTLHKLKRKYGGSVEDVLAFLEKAKRQLDEVEFATDRIEQLQKKLSGLQKTLLEQGTALTEARKAAAQCLQREISSELMQLDMPKIRFVCEFSEQTPQENGLDAVRFLMSANVGEALRPLSKVASGGELARIMLAMKNVLAAEDSVGTMIFDEVDAGVSGRAAQKVAYKLWTVAKGRQVLCVTHLPQIAAMADTEFTVEKRVENGRTYTSVLRLDNAGRRQELARLTGGSMITETTLAGAAELLRLAEQTKKGASHEST